MLTSYLDTNFILKYKNGNEERINVNDSKFISYQDSLIEKIEDKTPVIRDILSKKDVVFLENVLNNDFTQLLRNVDDFILVGRKANLVRNFQLENIFYMTFKDIFNSSNLAQNYEIGESSIFYLNKSWPIYSQKTK